MCSRKYILKNDVNVVEIPNLIDTCTADTHLKSVHAYLPSGLQVALWWPVTVLIFKSRQILYYLNNQGNAFNMNLTARVKLMLEGGKSNEDANRVIVLMHSFHRSRLSHNHLIWSTLPGIRRGIGNGCQ